MTPPVETPAKTTGGPGQLNWESAAEFSWRNASRIASWSLPFLLVVYLGLKGGGYDSIIRSEVGIAIWWIVLIGALLGILPAVMPRRNALVGLGLLLAFALWTGVGIAWSSDAGASVTELARVTTYLGVFALVLAMRQPGDMRRLIN